MLYRLLLLLLLPATGAAQIYMDKGRTQHTFAQTTIGVNTSYIPTSGKAAYLDDNGSIVQTAIPFQVRNRLVLSGLHFWGHADIYVSLPITNLRTLLDQNDAFNYDKGPEMGIRVFPWILETGKIRPFTGISMNTITYQQKIEDHPEGEGLTQIKIKLLTSFGAVLQSGNWLIEAGINWAPFNKLNYFIDRETKATITTPPFHFLAGVRYIFDSTLPDSPEKETKNSLRPLNALTLGIGPSFSLFIGNSNFNKERRPFLGNHQRTQAFPELTAGYYHYKSDLHVGLAYRQLKSTLKAYGVEQTVKRRAVSIEGYKFLFDYHGFIPFAGPVLSYEYLRFTEKENGTTLIDHSGELIRPGIIFGWDIRPSDHQLLILRTNLRYFPHLSLNISEDQKIGLNQLEFNLIQLVIHLNRL